MSNCCQPKYDSTFDDKLAKKELSAYLKKGVKKTSRPIVNILKQISVEGKKLLDIGGGVGVISFEMLKRGLAHSTQVDISQSYIRTFLNEAESKSYTNQVSGLQGDFTSVSDQVEQVDLVTLDKVICCYPNYENLIQKSLSKAKIWYAFTMPRDVWWVKAGHRITDIVRLFKPSLIQTYIHPTEKIEQMIEEAGFRKMDQTFRREWTTFLFERNSEN